MKIPIGPHQRAGRRRRRLKALVIAGVLLMMLLASNWTPWTPPEPDPSGPSIQDVVVARNLYAVSGDNGYPHDFMQAHPEAAAFVRGEEDNYGEERTW